MENIFRLRAYKDLFVFFEMEEMMEALDHLETGSGTDHLQGICCSLNNDVGYCLQINPFKGTN